MSVGILLVTHSGIGTELVKTAVKTFGNLPMEIKVLAVNYEEKIEDILLTAKIRMQQFRKVKDILVLTDMCGSTPFHIAKSLVNAKVGKSHIKLISGVNLPMLIRILNYPKLELDELATKALTGGREGVMALEA